MIDTRVGSRVGRTLMLRELGIDSYRHTGRGLSEHLLGTAALLDGWGCTEHVVVAGLLHAIYGTESYRAQPAPLADRRRVARMAGRDAERLAYLFGVMEKPSFYLNLLRPTPKRFVRSRLSHRRLHFREEEFVGLAHIVLANWLEQRPSVPPEYRSMRQEELLAMRPYLLPAARASLDEAYGFRD